MATNQAAGPPAAAGAPAAGADGAAPPAAGGWTLMSVVRMFVLYYIVSSFFKSGSAPKPSTDVATGVTHQPHRPLWRENTPYDLYVYVHHLSDLDLSTFTASQLNPSRLVWRERGLVFGQWEGRQAERAINWTFTDDQWMMQHLLKNGTLYAHVLFVRDHTPLFPYRGVGEPEETPYHPQEEADLHTQDALVIGADGGATSYALASSHFDLTPIPSSSSSDFSSRYVKSPRFNPGNIVHRVMELNIYRPAPKVVDKKNLLGVGSGAASNSSDIAVVEKKPEEVKPATAVEDEEDAEIEAWLEDDDGAPLAKPSSSSKGLQKRSSAPAAPWISMWKPFLSIRLIPDFTVFPYRGIPEEMRGDFVIDGKTDMYAPVVYFDYFWLLGEQLIPINSTLSSLSLNMSTSPLSLLKWRMEKQMETSWKMQQAWGMQEEDGRESEMFKRMVMDTNIYLLVITFAVSMLHMVFDFLAFKNDVAFWKNAKSLRGLSTRSILLNVICQSIIFLYLLDSDTSYMILVSNAIGIVIEVWKVQKCLVLTIDRSRPFPWVRIQNKNLSEDKKEEEKTEEEKEMELHAKYDAEAMTYLSYALYPLVFGYACYSLYYESHKSWYSFVLAVLTGCVYTFGFIMMCPQLYMNYKLKSVAHLPWRMLTYKALNTFIDDLFSFVIKMPMLHRLACFRDDIIFFIFLYQKWIYRVDYRRVNEFGTVLMSPEEQEKVMEEERQAALAKLNAESDAIRGAATAEANRNGEKKAVESEQDETTGKAEQQLRQRGGKAKATPANDVD